MSNILYDTNFFNLPKQKKVPIYHTENNIAICFLLFSKMLLQHCIVPFGVLKEILAIRVAVSSMVGYAI